MQKIDSLPASIVRDAHMVSCTRQEARELFDEIGEAWEPLSDTVALRVWSTTFPEYELGSIIPELVLSISRKEYEVTDPCERVVHFDEDDHPFCSSKEDVWWRSAGWKHTNDWGRVTCVSCQAKLKLEAHDRRTEKPFVWKASPELIEFGDLKSNDMKIGIKCSLCEGLGTRYSDLMGKNVGCERCKGTGMA